MVLNKQSTTSGESSWFYFSPVSPWYRSDLIAQASDVDNIVQFVYSIQVTYEKGIVSTLPDINKEYGNIANIIKVGTEYKLGEMIENKPLASLFKQYIIDICPNIPNVFEDLKNVDGYEMFKHGTRLISRQVLAIRQKKRIKRTREENDTNESNLDGGGGILKSNQKLTYSELFNLTHSLVHTIPLLIKSSQLNKTELIHLVSQLVSPFLNEKQINEDLEYIHNNVTQCNTQNMLPSGGPSGGDLDEGEVYNEWKSQLSSRIEQRLIYRLNGDIPSSVATSSQVPQVSNNIIIKNLNETNGVDNGDNNGTIPV